MTTHPSRAPYHALKLRARDAEDMQAIAACLQDALVPLGDVAFLKAEKRFVMVANRFLWETARDDAQRPAATQDPEKDQDGDARFEDESGDPGTLYERVNSGLCFDHVRSVKFRGVDARDRNQILNVLTLTCEPGAISMVFSGGAEIRLEIERISCHLNDINEPWPTRWRPAHDDDAAQSTDGA